ncbi:hypothetical protein AGABI2DRAFT_75048, partial [Agaricus bisporus var. bisporus H97]|uniref:hypothetical protein n=2 Tax=Agaricus bisporus var. bisporus (strain H97 / ATCC MYA-4626 / FGSC 10389) TaxID=936046 RepID=UPI00029F536A
YVELWYFTPKGCEVAASHAVTLEADTFTITKADSNLTLLPSRTSAVPKGHIIQDQHLSFSDMSIAKNNLIPHMTKCHWPPQLVQKFMDFFINLETHPIRSQPQGEQALLIYQAEARRDWYRDFAASKDNKTFDIAGIVESRLRQIADDIRISTYNQLIAVCPFNYHHMPFAHLFLLRLY